MFTGFVMSSVDTKVLKFLQDSNRPWSVNDILEKCGKDHGKSSIQKALDNLVSKGKVIEKLFVKQKIYFIKQEASKNTNASEAAKLEKDLAQLEAEFKTKSEKILKMKAHLKKFTNQLSIKDLEKERAELKEVIGNCNTIIEKSKNEASKKPINKLSLDDIKTIDNKHEKLVTQFQKRKRMCNEMIDAIMEGYPKSKKQLIEEVGIETDENVGFKLKY